MNGIELSGIVSILKSFLGEPKNEYDNMLSWSQWNCPSCSEDNFVETDNKFNLEINIVKNCFQCWKCGETKKMKGYLHKLVRNYGGERLLSEFNYEVNKLKQLIIIDTNNVYDIEDYNIVNILELPEKCYNIDNDNYFSRNAYEYLNRRGITDEIIKRYNLLYIGNLYQKNIAMKNRIVIPSYDTFGTLNYWVSRDYTENNKYKYLNCKVNKKSIIFNESLINWYDDIILCEGPFDSIVLPNSIPLLGKVLDKTFYLYESLITKAKSKVIIFLDGDAKNDVYKIYKLLNDTSLKDRVYYIDCPEDEDASSLYQKYGYKCIINLLRNKKQYTEFELLYGDTFI